MKAGFGGWLLAGLVLAGTTLVAFGAGRFVWQGFTSTTDDGSLLAAAIYAPFALVAAVIPAFTVPITARVMRAFRRAGEVSPTRLPRWLGIGAVLIFAELCWLVVAVASRHGPGSIPPLGHALLALYAVVNGFWTLQDEDVPKDVADDPEAPSEPGT